MALKTLLKKVAKKVSSKPKRGRPAKKTIYEVSPKRALTTTGVAAGAGYMAGKNSTKKEAPKPAAKKPVAAPKKPTRRAGPSGPTMTSMKAPSTGPKPRNKDEKKKPRRPSGPTMTSFKR